MTSAVAKEMEKMKCQWTFFLKPPTTQLSDTGVDTVPQLDNVGKEPSRYCDVILSTAVTKKDTPDKTFRVLQENIRTDEVSYTADSTDLIMTTSAILRSGGRDIIYNCETTDSTKLC